MENAMGFPFLVGINRKILGRRDSINHGIEATYQGGEVVDFTARSSMP